MTPTPWPTWARPAPLAPAAVAATVVALFSGGLLALWFAISLGSRAGLDFAVCAAPALVCLALGATSQVDRRQYLVRLLAAAAMLPLLAGFYATDAPGPWGVIRIVTLVLWFALHMVCFVALVAWMASATTRIEPAGSAGSVGVAGADAATRQMAIALRALATAQPSLVLQCADSGSWTLDSRQPEGRAHRVELRVVPQRGELRVREVSSAHGAAPATADEASMRQPGMPIVDASRPDAQRVWNLQWATTVIEAGKLPVGPFSPTDGLPSPAQTGQAAADPEALMHLLAALALRSGLTWQPTLAPSFQG